MNYVISDFKNLAGAWFNEFLPNAAGKNAGFVEDAGVVYINNLNVDTLRKPTLKFLQSVIAKMQEERDAIHVFVQEPKPVNNVRIRPVLKLMEHLRIDQDNRDKLLHAANRRYLIDSSTVYVSQNKEIDDLLAWAFKELSDMSFLKARFYPVQSLGMSDMLSCAYEFFPKSALTIQGEYEGNPIRLHSSNDFFGTFSDKIMKGKPLDSETLDYVWKCRKAMLDDMARLV